MGGLQFLDFHQKVTAGKEQIEADIAETTGTINATKLEADNLRKDLASARAALGSLPKDVQILQSKVSQIEERIGYVASPALTPQLKKKLQSLLESFQIYCRNVGFPVKPGDVKVHIYAGNTPEPGKAAYYDPAKSEMRINTSFADDPSVVLREYMHRQLDRSPAVTTHLDRDYVAVEAGLSCYYPASFRNLSDCGGWDLNRLDSYAKHRSAAPALAVVWGVNVWGGLFWEMRGTLGQEKSDSLLAIFWKELNPEQSSPNFAQYVSRTLLETVNKVDPANNAKVRGMLSARAIPLP